jgi:hypothetical protein
MNHEHSVQKGEATTTEEQREIAIKVLYVWRRFTTGSWRYRKRGEVKGAIARRRKGGTKIKRRLKGGKQEGRTKTYLKKETKCICIIHKYIRIHTHVYTYIRIYIHTYIRMIHTNITKVVHVHVGDLPEVSRLSAQANISQKSTM